LQTFSQNLTTNGKTINEIVKTKNLLFINIAIPPLTHRFANLIQYDSRHPGEGTISRSAAHHNYERDRRLLANAPPPFPATWPSASQDWQNTNKITKHNSSYFTKQKGSFAACLLREGDAEVSTSLDLQQAKEHTASP
jgi:hypothetical protein